MKRYFCLFCALMLFVLQPAALGESRRIKVDNYFEWGAAAEKFRADHPEITVEFSEKNAYSTTQLINAFLSGDFDYDVFHLFTYGFHVNKLIEKGYLAPLPEAAAQYVRQMHPAIQKAVTLEGQVYAMPWTLSLSYTVYNPQIWAEAGLTEEDAPHSFSQFLDFLERWCDRGENEDTTGFVICCSFDESEYGPTTYTTYLIDRLMENYLMDQNHSQTLLRFDTPEFKSLLHRCMEMGKRLYQIERTPNQGKPLFEEPFALSLSQLPYWVSLKTEEDGPDLLYANLSLVCLYAKSDVQELGAEWAIDILNASDYLKAFLMADPQPVLDPEYDEKAARYQEKIDAAEAHLASGQLDQGQREAWQRMRDQNEEALAGISPYLISPEELANYRQYGDCLCIQMPTPFDPATEAGKAVTSLRDQLVNGLMDADQFILRLDDVARMMEREDQ